VFKIAFFFLCVLHSAIAQLPVDSITETAVSRMRHYLALNSLKGRANYTYHQPRDEAKKIDSANRIRISRAIAAVSRNLIAGTDTPVLCQYGF